LTFPLKVGKCYQFNMPFETEKIDDPFEIIREFTVLSALGADDCMEGTKLL
jgi:hypothetical protein